MASTIHRSPSRSGCFFTPGIFVPRRWISNSVMPRAAQSITHRARVVAPVEMQGPDLVEQPCGVDGVDGGLEHGDVVAVGAVDRPAHRYAVTLGGDRPLPAELGPIR